MKDFSEENSNIHIFHVLISIIMFYKLVSLSYTYAPDPPINYSLTACSNDCCIRSTQPLIGYSKGNGL